MKLKNISKLLSSILLITRKLFSASVVFNMQLRIAYFLLVNISLVKSVSLNGQINLLNQYNFYWLPNDNTTRSLELEILLKVDSLTNTFQLTKPADVCEIYKNFLIQDVRFQA
jgi:hypothetical protein